MRATQHRPELAPGGRAPCLRCLCSRSRVAAFSWGCLPALWPAPAAVLSGKLRSSRHPPPPPAETLRHEVPPLLAEAGKLVQRFAGADIPSETDDELACLAGSEPCDVAAAVGGVPRREGSEGPAALGGDERAVALLLTLCPPLALAASNPDSFLGALEVRPSLLPSCCWPAEGCATTALQEGRCCAAPLLSLGEAGGACPSAVCLLICSLATPLCLPSLQIAGGYFMTLLYGILPPLMAWQLREKLQGQPTKAGQAAIGSGAADQLPGAPALQPVQQQRLPAAREGGAPPPPARPEQQPWWRQQHEEMVPGGLPVLASMFSVACLIEISRLAADAGLTGGSGNAALQVGRGRFDTPAWEVVDVGVVASWIAPVHFVDAGPLSTLVCLCMASRVFTEKSQQLCMVLAGEASTHPSLRTPPPPPPACPAAGRHSSGPSQPGSSIRGHDGAAAGGAAVRPLRHAAQITACPDVAPLVCSALT